MNRMALTLGDSHYPVSSLRLVPAELSSSEPAESALVVNVMRSHLSLNRVLRIDLELVDCTAESVSSIIDVPYKVAFISCIFPPKILKFI